MDNSIWMVLISPMLFRGHRGRDCMVVGITTTSTCVIRVPTTTKVVSSNPTQGEVYSIQHYAINFISDCDRSWFSLCTPVSSTNKSDRYNMAEILLKVALNTINQPIPYIMYSIKM